ncbi:MAG: hypothetical protein ACXWMF_06605 [Syntrophales bacterium]
MKAHSKWGTIPIDRCARAVVQGIRSNSLSMTAYGTIPQIDFSRDRQ